MINSKHQVHFMISAPRSGSTWMATALGRHPAVGGLEQRLFGMFCELWPQPNGSMAPRITLDRYTEVLSHHWMLQGDVQEKKALAQLLTTRFMETLLETAAGRTGKSVFVDKITPYPHTIATVLAGIREHAPDARLILLQRDGRDVLTSLVFDWLNREPKDSPRQRFFVAQEAGCDLERFFTDDDIQRWAAHWVEIQSGMTLAAGAHVVRYESMKASPEDVLRGVFEFLEVAADTQLVEQIADSVSFEKMTGRKAGDGVATAKARKGVVGDWRNYFTRRDGELFHEIAGETMWRLQYEASSNWLGQLPERLHLSR